VSGVLLTAGYDRAWHSVVVAELLRRAGHAPKMILIAYPTSFKRIRAIIRSRGRGAIFRYVLRRAGDATITPLREAALAAGIVNPSLSGWARQYGVRVVVTRDLNSLGAVREVAALAPEVTAYTGGGILGRAFLQAANHKVLNAHSGPLPAIRGMNALEWSLLLGHPTGITLHQIDEGIDTGNIAEWVPVSARKEDSLDVLRERLIVVGVKAMVKWVLLVLGGTHPIPTESQPGQRQCFVLSPALRELAELQLRKAQEVNFSHAAVPR
jgi:methionyl-tRNA formyltransferase